jgi:hypothetical protein
MSYPKHKKVYDLGIAAWIKMHGHQISKIEIKCINFLVENEKMDVEIDNLKNSYVNSEACEYDSWLMSLKQLPITRVDNLDPEIVIVDGLGPSAFVRHKGRWRLIGRESNSRFAFFVPMPDNDEFNNLRVSWTNSELRTFDAAMMSIKNMRIKNNKR